MNSDVDHGPPEAGFLVDFDKVRFSNVLLSLVCEQSLFFFPAVLACWLVHEQQCDWTHLVLAKAVQRYLT